MDSQFGLTAGIVKTYYDNDFKHPKTETFEIDGKREGPSKTYHENGDLAQICNYINDKLEGECLQYFKNTQNLGCVCYYSGSLLHGPHWIYFDTPERKPRIISNYNQNDKEGEYQEFYENGQCRLKCYFLKNKFDGLYEEFYQNGVIKIRITYKNGKKIGLTQLFYESGNVKYEKFY